MPCTRQVLFEEVFKILPQAWPPQDEDEDEDVGQQGGLAVSDSGGEQKGEEVKVAAGRLSVWVTRPQPVTVAATRARSAQPLRPGLN